MHVIFHSSGKGLFAGKVFRDFKLNNVAICQINLALSTLTNSSYLELGTLKFHAKKQFEEVSSESFLDFLCNALFPSRFHMTTK